MTTVIANRQTSRLTHQVNFRATPQEAADALKHYTHRFITLGLTCSSNTTDHTEGVFTSQTRITLTGDQQLTANLTICQPARAFSADVDTYTATAVISSERCNQELIDNLYSELDHLPYTGTELAHLRRQFPLCQQFAASMNPATMANVAFYMSIHHMGDFVAMMDAMIAMGANPAHITIMDKGYPYTNRERVDGWLRHTLGIQVDYYKDRAASIRGHVERAKKSGLKTLIMDDGGYTWPVVAEHLPHEMDHFIGIVEQTMSGIWKLEGQPLPLPVFSVAESDLKATVEPYGVAAAAVRALHDRIPHEKLEGRPVLVLGYGRIGRQVALILRDMRMRVAVYDPNTVALVSAHEEGFETSRDLNALIERHQPLLVCGNAGRGSLGRDNLKAFKNDAYLVSGTSRTYEFDLDAFAQAAEEVVDHGILGHTYKLAGGVELCVVGHGMPLNFYHAESLPNRYIDMIIAALLQGGTTLLSPDSGGFQPGHNLELTNAILASSSVLDTYLDTYADPSAPRDLLLPAGRPYTGIPWTFDQ
ncbi:hypothetical protein GCM10010430_43800 [Kitasatospora cystarginea]|uniref:S-adenosyl-L-homocysteine hydrolase NAD binding domain-containing protein n=1 Tax=Kitasatospora cystarginea TaxID=58350 RepID=A0ABN3EDQ1_9ACTN